MGSIFNGFMAHYLITGGSGFLGSYLVGELLGLGHSITVIKRKTSSIARLKPYEGAIQLINAEDMTVQNTNKLFESIDTIFHLATNYGRKHEDAKEAVYTNYDWPLELFLASRNTKVKKFINFDTLLSENINTYAKTKKQFLNVVKILCEDKGYPQLINIKLSNFYGPGEDLLKLVTYLVNSFKNNIKEVMLTEGQQKIDLVYISDVIEGTIHILNTSNNLNKKFNEFTIGTGTLTSVNEVAILLKNKLKSDTHINFGALAYRNNEVMEPNLDLKPLNKMGWKAKIDLSRGLDAVISALKKIK